MDSCDSALTAIFADPRVANDLSNPIMKAYLGLFPEGDKSAANLVEWFVAEGKAGHFYRPEPGKTMASSTVQSVELHSRTEAVATVCTVTSIDLYDASGRRLSSEGGANLMRAVMTKVGDRWLLQIVGQVKRECTSPTGDT